ATAFTVPTGTFATPGYAVLDIPFIFGGAGSISFGPSGGSDVFSVSWVGAPSTSFTRWGGWGPLVVSGQVTKGAPSVPCNVGLAMGDIHLRTFDGLLYEMQATGQFTLARDGSDGLEVQVQTAPWRGRTDVSVNDAVSALVGGDRLVFYVDGTLHLNGVATAPADGTTPLPGGGRLVRAGSAFRVLWPDATELRVSPFEDSLDVIVILSQTRLSRATASISGLLGNANCNTADDLATRDRSVTLSAPAPFQSLYGTFMPSWCVIPTGTLFDAATGEPPACVAPTRLVTPDVFPPEVLAAARATCQARGVSDDWLDACVVDVVSSGNVTATFAADLVGLPPIASRLAVSCAADNECSDGDACNGIEVCDAASATCRRGSPPQCDDGLFCNGAETCNPATGGCVAGTAPACDDGRFCDGAETCDEATRSCQPGAPPDCSDGLDCNGVEACDDAANRCAVPAACADAGAGGQGGAGVGGGGAGAGGGSSVPIAIPGLFPTGVDDNGVALAAGAADPHYTILDPAQQAIVIDPAASPWIQNTAGYRWVWQTASGTPVDVTRTFRVTFSLNGLDPLTASVGGTWATDNLGSIALNGQHISGDSGGFSAFASFSVPAGSALFVPGTNTLDFTVTDQGVVAGFLVGSIHGTASSVAPPFAGPPAITGLSPRIVSPGTPITVAGANLTTASGGTSDVSVALLGASGQPPVSLSIVSGSPNQITVQVPAAVFQQMPGLATISVTTPEGTAVSTDQVTIAAPTIFQGGAGLFGAIYALQVNTPKLPNFGDIHSLTAACADPSVINAPATGTPCPLTTFEAANLDVPLQSFTAGFPGFPQLIQWFAIRLRGVLTVDTPGSYQFETLSDDGSNVYLLDLSAGAADGGAPALTQVVSNDGVHAFAGGLGPSTTLAAGRYEIIIDYFQGPPTGLGIQLFWLVPGAASPVIVPAGSLQALVP
ncbi:MAG: VWD domain-containing protein, partial [Verrucomicrobiota bacterium]